jgi:ABC-type multidrug transport system fused ATPase/permease subunit
VLDLASTRAVVAYAESICTDLVLRLTQGYNEMQWARYVQRNHSELLNHSMTTAREASNFYHVAIELIASAVVITLMAGVLVYQSPAAALSLGLIATTFFGIHRFLLRPRLQRAATQRENSVRQLQRILADMFTSAREIRSYGSQVFTRDRVRQHAESVAASYRRVAFLPQLARISADQGVVLLFLSVVIVMQLRHGDTRHLLSLLAFYFVLSRRLLPLIGQLSFLAGQMESSYKSVITIYAELEECAAYRNVAASADKPRGGHILEVDRVSYLFAGHDGCTLKDVSFSIGEGEIVVVCGASGSGKSTLLNIIAGLLVSPSGAVRVDRNRVAYVPQDIVLLDESIRSNLLFGLEAVSDGELMRALTIANLAEFVASNPLGLGMAVGDNGISLSGGQRQRAGLARAVARGAKLLLLDESTSALDAENEATILDNLRAAGIAVLLVSHRLHGLAEGRRVLRLAEGRLMEQAKDGGLVESADAVVLTGAC